MRKLCRLQNSARRCWLPTYFPVFFSLDRERLRYIERRDTDGDCKQGTCRCPPQRLHLPPRPLPRVRIHLRPGKPHPAGVFLHRDLRREIPALRTHVHDIRHRRPGGGAQPGHRPRRRAPVRLPDAHLANVWRRQELHHNAADGEALVWRDPWVGAG